MLRKTPCFISIAGGYKESWEEDWRRRQDFRAPLWALRTWDLRVAAPPLPGLNSPAFQGPPFGGPLYR